LDPRGNVIDSAGNGGPPFAGGRNEEDGRIVNRSMERLHPVMPGDLPASWEACQSESGGTFVRDQYQSVIRATPGEPNSGGEPEMGDEEPEFRSESGER
jgi:hypothetical protein